MADDAAMLAQISGPGIAAFTLSQIVFWAFVDSGLVSKDEATGKLRQAIDAIGEGDPGNVLAAQLLALMLKDLEKRPKPIRQ